MKLKLGSTIWISDEDEFPTFTWQAYLASKETLLEWGAVPLEDEECKYCDLDFITSEQEALIKVDMDGNCVKCGKNFPDRAYKVKLPEKIGYYDCFHEDRLQEKINEIINYLAANK